MRDLISSKEANKGWSYRVKTIFKPQGPTESWFTFVLWIISISIDPLLYYLPVINDDKKSLEFNIKLVGLLGVLLLLLQSCGFAVKQAYFLTSCSFVLQFLLLNAMISADVAVFTIAVISFLVLYSWRVYGVYGLLPYKVTSRYAEEDAKTLMNKLVLNLVLFLYGGYVFGGIWYLFAIRKKTECWKKACRNHNGCHLDATFGFIVSSGETKFLNDNCPKILETNYAESYELGMFKDAFEFGIVESKNFPRKLLHCFRWGIQNLSGIGQSLPASSHAAENIFLIFIIIYGVVMFAYFLGNLQMYIKYATEASGKKRRKEQEIIRKQMEMEIEKWVPFGNLSEELQNCIKENQQYQRIEIVDVNNLLKNVSVDIENNIKRELCLEPLKKLLEKVGKLEKWSEALMFCLCDHLEPVVYTKGDHIGSCMTFVIQGMLVSSCITTRETDLLKVGDFWGEEFVNCIQNDPSYDVLSAESITSDKTIKVLKKVEAFELQRFSLKSLSKKNLYNEKAKVIQSWFRQFLIRRDAQASIQEQTLTGDDWLTAKVEEFSEQLLHELRDCAKPVSYAEHAEFRRGSSIDEMLFLVTIQTIKKVDAFALMSYDLQSVFIKHQTPLSTSTQVQAPPPADSQPQSPPPPAEPPAQQPANQFLSLSLSLANSLVGSALDLHLSAAALTCFGWLSPGVLRLWGYCYWSQEMNLEEGTGGQVSGGLRDRPNSVLGNLQRIQVQAIRSINESMKSCYHNIIGLVNSIGRQHMSLAYVFPSIWCVIKILLDPFYLYTSLINYDYKCVAVDDYFWPMSKYFNGFVILIVMLSVGSLFSVVLIKGRRFEATIWLFLVVIDLWTYVGPPSSQQPLKAVFPAAGAGNFYSSVFAFGQSLQASTDAWENILVISITIYSMALFVFFIGNVQIYLQSKTVKSEMIRQKKQQIEQCTSFAKLSENLQKQIKRYQPDIWEETKGVDFEFLFNLPEDLRKNTKRELCLELLKKVDEFRSWSEQLLEELCDCVKPVSYAQHAEIVRKGSSIDEMLFWCKANYRPTL
ncbi:hypothetical protein LWI28_019421 [Acer negundo]|uniref:Cyclic nucleotide-binding domain-containing protein n=1 Tax=Acer negundo TaxID=4023 RepID=A0AAD5IJ97_ACENE|nr:hypothetical protein LWI28_019421 [Acer negundo]